MKIAIITDTHSGARNDNPAFNNFFLRFYEEIFFPYLKEHPEIRTVVHGGDVFDRRKYVNLNTLSSWNKRVFTPLNNMVDRVDILIGNHDTYFKNTNGINSVSEILGQYQNFKVYENATDVSFDGLDILYVPWICEDNTDHTMEMISKTRAPICIGHLELNGFEVTPGQPFIGHGLGASDFNKFDQVFTGHFHHKQSKGNVNYLGSPYPIYWNDWGCRRGFHVYETETRKLEFIENPLQIFHKIYYNDTKFKEFDELIQGQSAKDMFVKVHVQKKTNPYWFDLFIEALEKSGAYDVAIEDDTLIEQSDEQESFDETKDTLSFIMECVDSSVDPMYNEAVKELLKELYTEALNTNDQTQSD